MPCADLTLQITVTIVTMHYDACIMMHLAENTICSIVSPVSDAEEPSDEGEDEVDDPHDDDDGEAGGEVGQALVQNPVNGEKRF